MNLWNLTLLLALLMTGCASPRTPDSISRFVRSLADEEAEAKKEGHHGYAFPAGLWSTIPLPSETPIAQVAKEAVKQVDWLGASHLKVVTIRRVRICRPELPLSLYDPSYTAILVQTPTGRNIVLLQFRQAQGSHPACWENKVFDAP